ncbi:hypothetical protein BS47DRAFT_1401818 [Hydnum rufescens UP504]|uniref:Uncharacterized protein n=1 Tax=Hydnum rufescens UP504 TaxID=1448309 RepID=A0A9P6DMF4_9AGAM|nr:hypothetical protein BS47DRAFT_1401818 [Hydnum rufescens UP504]
MAVTRWREDRSGSLLLIILSLGLVGIQQGPMLQQCPNLQLDHGLHSPAGPPASAYAPPLVASVIAPHLNAVPLKSWHCINISPISEFDWDVEWVLWLRQWEVLAAHKSKPTWHKGAPYHIFLMFKAEGRHNACWEYLRNEQSRYSLTGVEDYIWEKPLQNFVGVVDIFYIDRIESSLGQIILDYERYPPIPVDKNALVPRKMDVADISASWYSARLAAAPAGSVTCWMLSSGDDDSGSHRWNGYWQPGEWKQADIRKEGSQLKTQDASEETVWANERECNLESDTRLDLGAAMGLPPRHRGFNSLPYPCPVSLLAVTSASAVSLCPPDLRSASVCSRSACLLFASLLFLCCVLLPLLSSASVVLCLFPPSPPNTKEPCRGPHVPSAPYPTGNPTSPRAPSSAAPPAHGTAVVELSESSDVGCSELCQMSGNADEWNDYDHDDMTHDEQERTFRRWLELSSVFLRLSLISACARIPFGTEAGLYAGPSRDFRSNAPQPPTGHGLHALQALLASAYGDAAYGTAFSPSSHVASVYCAFSSQCVLFKSLTYGDQKTRFNNDLEPIWATDVEILH